MSRTAIFLLEHGKNRVLEFSNAWRGAMYVWSDVAKRYCGLKHFPTGIFDDDEDRQMEVWNYDNRHPGEMAEHEAIVLLSTMDHALLEPDQWERLVEAFEKYGAEHPGSSYSEQAAALRDALEGPGEDVEMTGIGWLQTSVCDTEWLVFGDDEEERRPYNPAQDSGHFWLFEQFDANRAAA